METTRTLHDYGRKGTSLWLSLAFGLPFCCRLFANSDVAGTNFSKADLNSKTSTNPDQIRKDSVHQVKTDPSVSYENAVKKGAVHLASMRQSKKEAQEHPIKQSDWTEFSDLQKYGWRSPRFIVGDSDTGALQPALKGLGLDDEQNHSVALKHIKPSTIKDQMYQPTDGDYSATYNATEGFIAVKGEYSPKHTSLNKPGFKGPVVPLHKWSDITWLEWQNLCDGGGDDGDSESVDISDGERHDIRNLKQIIVLDIKNEHTEAILEKIKSNHGIPDRFPDVRNRLKLDASGEDALALLGSPNGSRIPWLLNTHRARLGRKVVDSVELWHEEGIDGANLRFVIDDFSPPDE